MDKKFNQIIIRDVPDEIFNEFIFELKKINKLKIEKSECFNTLKFSYRELRRIKIDKNNLKKLENNYK